MTGMTVVEDHNQDDMSRKAGCYLYVDTKLGSKTISCIGGMARGDFPDALGAVHHGKEVTRDVKTYFIQNKWPIERGLDTSEKRAQFSSTF